MARVGYAGSLQKLYYFYYYSPTIHPPSLNPNQNQIPINLKSISISISHLFLPIPYTTTTTTHYTLHTTLRYATLLSLSLSLSLSLHPYPYTCYPIWYSMCACGNACAPTLTGLPPSRCTVRLRRAKAWAQDWQASLFAVERVYGGWSWAEVLRR